MQITGKFRVTAPRDQVFVALKDADNLRACIPGCESLQEVEPNVYDAQVSIGFPGMKGRYTGRASITEIVVPESYTLAINGRGKPGFVNGTATLVFVEVGDETEVTCSSDVQVGGVIAAVGSRMIQAGAKKMMDDFFQRFRARIDGDSPDGE